MTQMDSAERAAALRKGCECFRSWHKCEVQCDVRYLVAIRGKLTSRGHRVFVDAEVIRGRPLQEVAGHGREAPRRLRTW